MGVIQVAGAWELKEANQVLVGILHTDVTTLSWSFGIRNLIIPGKEEHRRFSPFMPVCGMPFDHARNACAQQCLALGAEWMFFLDSDVVPPRDALLRLISRRLPFVAGVYHRRSPPAGVPVMQKPAGQWVLHYPPNTLIEVDVVGSGCMLIHRSVLESMPPQDPARGKTYFDWKVDMAHTLPPGEGMSEDFTFCAAIRKHLGVKIMVDTGVQCKHLGFAEAGYGTFSPMQCVPVT